MLRPKIATLRLYLIAVSTTCCMRCTFEEKVAIIMRFLALRKAFSKAIPTVRSLGVCPSRSAFVLSANNTKTPLFPKSMR